jgi:hypothetical protein
MALLITRDLDARDVAAFERLARKLILLEQEPGHRRERIRSVAGR